MTLIPEQHPLEHRTSRDNSGLRSFRIKSQQIQLRRDELRGFFRISGRTSTAAVNIGSEIMNFFTIFISDFGSSGCPGICSKYNSIFVYETDDCCSCLGSLREVTVVAGIVAGIVVTDLLNHSISMNVIKGKSRGFFLGISFHAVGIVGKF
jgi:hypothetical protein